VRTTLVLHTQEDSVAVRICIEELLKQNPGDRCFYRPGDPDKGEPMLLLYVTASQLRMLPMYGNDLVCVDATHKTTQWDMPLYLLSIIDNHNKGGPVAFAMIERDTTEGLSEVLRM
jgi:hypothetical protein